MFKKSELFFIRTITSLHAGSGNDLGIVDLPIQREKHTSFPKIESSSLKGSLREAFENNIEQKKKDYILGIVNSGHKIELDNDLNDYNYAIHLAFGYDDDGVNNKIKDKFEGNSEFSGCLAFTDARLILFPVKSMKGIFAWITCPYVLKRFKEDMEISEKEFKLDLSNIKPEIGKCLISSKSEIIIKENVILEEYSFASTENDTILNELCKFINNDELLKKLVILSDDDFKNFVNLSTEVITRTKIDNATGTVKSGALFNEEYLPPETMMYFMVFASPVFQKDPSKKGIFKNSEPNSNANSEAEKVFDFFEKGLPEYVQIGGNATIGKGICKMNFINSGFGKEEK